MPFLEKRDEDAAERSKAGALVLDDQFEQEERWRDLRSEKWFNALAYVWRVGANFFYILVVLYVFSRLYERFEVIVVALFGVLYVTMRTIGNGLVMFNSQFGIALDKELDAIKGLLDASHRRDKAEFNQAQRRSATLTKKIYIDIFGMAVISLICLWRLFSVL